VSHSGTIGILLAVFALLALAVFLAPVRGNVTPIDQATPTAVVTATVNVPAITTPTSAPQGSSDATFSDVTMAAAELSLIRSSLLMGVTVEAIVDAAPLEESDEADLWLVAFAETPAYRHPTMDYAWETGSGEWWQSTDGESEGPDGEWYFLINQDDRWALGYWENDSPSNLVWIQIDDRVTLTRA
jgi:hypothetical protein